MTQQNSKSISAFITSLRSGGEGSSSKKSNLFDSLPQTSPKQRSSQADNAEFPYDGSNIPRSDRDEKVRKNSDYLSFNPMKDRNPDRYMERIEREDVYPMRDPESIYSVAGGAVKGTPEQISQSFALGTYMAAVYLQSKLKGKDVSIRQFLETAAGVLSFTDFSEEIDVDIVDVCVSWLMYSNENPMSAMARAKNTYKAKHGKKIGIDATTLGFAYIVVENAQVEEGINEDLSTKITEHLLPPYLAKHDNVVKIAEAVASAYGIKGVTDHKDFLDDICEGRTFNMPTSNIEFQKLTDTVGLTAHSPLPAASSRALQVLAYRAVKYLFGAHLLFVRDAKDNISADFRLGADSHRAIPLPEKFEHASNLLLSTIIPYQDILMKMIEIEMTSSTLNSEQKKSFSHIKELHKPYKDVYAHYRRAPMGLLHGDEPYMTLYKGSMMSALDIKRLVYDVDHDNNKYYVFLMTVNEANQLRADGVQGIPVVLDQGTNSVLWIPFEIAATMKKSAKFEDIVTTVKPNFGFFALPTVKSGAKKSMSKAWLASTLYALIERYKPDAPVLDKLLKKSGFTEKQRNQNPTDIGNVLFSRSRLSYYDHGYAPMVSLVIAFPPAGIRAIIKHNSVGFPKTEVFSTDVDLSKIKRSKNLRVEGKDDRSSKRKGVDDNLDYDKIANQDTDTSEDSGYQDEFPPAKEEAPVALEEAPTEEAT